MNTDNPLFISVKKNNLFTKDTMQISVKDILKNKGVPDNKVPYLNVQVGLILNYWNDRQEFGKYYTFPVSSQACHLGGKRYWICCPLCGKRRYALFLRDIKGGFLCRDCLELRYVSKTVLSPIRLSRHYGNLAEALEHRPGPKPKRYRKFIEYRDDYFRLPIARFLINEAKKKLKETG
ncbi:MAG TPA: hypothetical protein VN944_09875 [Nitrospiria bacterium]|nr:hypothetical protein [Nitrospiria bacterium]